MISCEEASIICNKTQYKEATFMEKIKLNLHLFVCNTCSKFSKKNTKLTLLFEKTDLRSLSESEKIEMKQQLQEKI